MHARLLPAIFLGGAAGGLSRAALEQAWPANGHSWPWVTFAVNIAGTVVLASLFVLVQQWRRHPPYLGPLLGIGLCGALTTFSTLQLELLQMLDHGEGGLAAGYAVASVAAGLLAIALTTNLVRRARLAA